MIPVSDAQDDNKCIAKRNALLYTLCKERMW